MSILGFGLGKRGRSENGNLVFWAGEQMVYILLLLQWHKQCYKVGGSELGV